VLVKSLRDIEARLLRGDHVTTRELKAAHEHYGRLRTDLGELGQHWRFAFGEANRLWSMCRQYLDARKHPV
jgi:hypothetical protein